MSRFVVEGKVSEIIKRLGRQDLNDGLALGQYNTLGADLCEIHVVVEFPRGFGELLESLSRFRLCFI